MSKYATSLRRTTGRVAAMAALTLTLAGMTVAPALATETGVISKYRGNYPTYNTCVDAGRRAQSSEHSDSYACYKQSNNTYDLYLMWYT